MNVIFSDVNKSFSSMIQQDIPGKVMVNGDDTSSKNHSFAENLSKTLEKIEQTENRSSLQTQSIHATEDSEKITKFLSEKLNREKGIDFITELKNILLMMSKGELKNISIDSNGLETLRIMLLQAGFDESEVNELMAGFLEELENKTLTLDDFMDKLFDLPLEEKVEIEPPDENFLETSALPFLESILTSLGIPREKVQSILSAADKEGNGISLDIFIEKLQVVQKQSFYTQEYFQTREVDENFTMLIKQLDLEQNDFKPSQLTLDEFVSSLEKLRQKMAQQQTSIEVPGNNTPKPVASEKDFDLFTALFKGLEINNKALETQTFEFSHDQIKNQFKNGLLVQAEEKFEKNVKPTPDIKLENAFKEMASLVDGKKSGIAGINDQLKDNKEFLKQLKSGTQKFSDQTQILTSDAKISEVQSNVDILKTKSSFKNLPTYVTHQVSKSLVRAINQGDNILKIQLNPPELGRLVMTIDNTKSSIRVHIVTENFAAKEILTSNVNELRTVLSNSGVNFERVEVDMSSNFKQSMADARNQTKNFGKQKQNRENLLIDPVNNEDMNDSVSLIDAVNQGRSLHFVA